MRPQWGQDQVAKAGSGAAARRCARPMYPSAGNASMRVRGARGEAANGRRARGGKGSNCTHGERMPSLVPPLRLPRSAHEQKQKLVGEVFSSVAASRPAELRASLGGSGLEALFSATAQSSRRSRARLGRRTGDISALLKARVGERGEIVLATSAACDRRAATALPSRNVRGFEYVQCNAERCRSPIQLDLVTIASAAQTSRQGRAWAMLRVLKIGGQAECWSFPRSRPIGSSRCMTPLVQGAAAAGKLLPTTATVTRPGESIRHHPAAAALQAMMEAPGFARCTYKTRRAVCCDPVE